MSSYSRSRYLSMNSSLQHRIVADRHEIAAVIVVRRQEPGGDVLFEPAAGVPRHEQRKRLTVQQRSEEHTSDLQSLMRISYAVFCSKKTTSQPYYNFSHIFSTYSSVIHKYKLHS